MRIARHFPRSQVTMAVVHPAAAATIAAITSGLLRGFAGSAVAMKNMNRSDTARPNSGQEFGIARLPWRLGELPQHVAGFNSASPVPDDELRKVYAPASDLAAMDPPSLSDPMRNLALPYTPFP